MEKGNLAKWCKKEGDKISPGEIIAEVETDKATIDFEMQEEGYVAKILVPEGAKDVSIGDLVAILVENKEDIAAFKDFTAGSAGPAAPKPAKKEAKPEPAQPKEEVKAAPTQVSEPARAAGDRVIASPYAKTLATEKGVNLGGLTGTGPHGRIIAADVQEFKPKAAAAPVTPAPTTTAFEDIPLTQMRKIIAQRLSLSKETIPHYYVSVECEVDKLLVLREKLNKFSTAKISVNDMIVKAASLAALQVPQTNSSWQGEFIRQFKNVDMSVAVSTPKGLITPIIKNANVKGLQQIAAEMKDLAARARENKLKLDEFQGGTFSISNMGMFGVAHFSAIVNPPQACILAIGAALKRVVPNDKAKEGESPFRTASILTVTLSSDHRVVDGADAAQWGQHFKKYIENPELMLL